jgi:1,4-dihydroxy-2-naphthoate octaprenyltransferase
MALPQSLLPAMTAVCLAIPSPNFSWWLAVIAVIGVAFGHLGINLFDDYFDYKKDNQSIRNRLNSSGIRARIAKCDYLKSNQANMKQLFVAASVFCAVALLAGTVVFIQRGASILIISAVTALLGVGYSGSPFKFSYRGLGEVIIGVVFGPLLMLGVYLSACGTVSQELLFISIPIGLLVMNVVYTHSVIDYEADKAMNKRTLAVLLEKKNSMNIVSFLIIFLPFLIIGIGIFLKILSVWYAFVFVMLFMAIYLFRIILSFQRGSQEKIQPKWWMGMMGNWQNIVAAGIDWFMIRWYLARNLLTFFCLIIIIISLL